MQQQTASRIILDRVFFFLKMSMPSLHFNRTAFLVFSCWIDHFHCFCGRLFQRNTKFHDASQFNVTYRRHVVYSGVLDNRLTLKQCWSVENLKNVMIFSGNDVMTFRCWSAFSRIFCVIKITGWPVSLLFLLFPTFWSSALLFPTF